MEINGTPCNRDVMLYVVNIFVLRITNNENYDVWGWTQSILLFEGYWIIF